MKKELHEVISVDGLTKRIGAITALDHISFSVHMTAAYVLMFREAF